MEKKFLGLPKFNANNNNNKNRAIDLIKIYIFFKKKKKEKRKIIIRLTTPHPYLRFLQCPCCIKESEGRKEKLVNFQTIRLKKGHTINRDDCGHTSKFKKYNPRKEIL
jgi:hypothetical protein